MKKQLALCLALALCLGLLAACGTNQPATTTAAPATAAPATTAAATTPAATTPAATTPAATTAPPETTAPPVTDPPQPMAKRVTEYLYTLYGKMAAPTPEDYMMPASLTIDGNQINIDWAVEAADEQIEAISLVREDKVVRVDVNEESPEEVPYTLTASVSYDGVTDSVSFAHVIPASSSDLSVAETVARLYALEPGQTLPGTHVMRGTITEVVTEYSADYNNVTVNLLVTDEDHIVQCFRLSGGKELKAGDEITVMGALKRYKDTFEFDAGAVYSADLSVEEMKQLLVLDKLYALEAGDSLKGTYVLRGTVVEIPTPYSADYDNVTVNLRIFEDDERIVQCYRLAGGKDLAVGDVITVTGALKRYKDTFEFDAGATYSKELTLEQAKAALLLEQLFALNPGESLKGLYTMTGKITEIVSAYSPDYGNISVNLLITDEEHIVQCYRLSGGEELKAGDVITVTGNLKRYKDTFEFDAGCTYVKVEE